MNMMKPSLAQGTPGVSLNFDAQALQEQEEAEYRREELQQQNELKQLLEDALDDLSDDDDQFELSQDPTSLGHHMEDKVNALEQPWPTPAGGQPHMPVMSHAQTSTPIIGTAPPLATPATMQHDLPSQTGPRGVYAENHGYPVRGGAVQGERAGLGHYGSQEWDQHMQPTSQGIRQDIRMHDHYGNLPYSERGETEGGNDEGYYGHFQNENYMANGYGNQIGHGQEIPNYHGYHVEQPGGEVFYGGGYQQPSSQQHDDQPIRRDEMYGNQNPQMYGGIDMQPSHPESPPRPEPKPPLVLSPRGSLENYRVAYRGSQPQSDAVTEHTFPAQNTRECNPLHAESKPGNVPTFDKMQQEFLNQGGVTEDRQLGQLQILYNARGHKLEEITQEYENFKEESNREVRILKHKLALSQDESDGLANSLDQSKQLVVEAKNREADLHGKAAAMETQIQALSSAKEELVKKLQTAESTIESLNAQLHELGTSETLSRAREQHESVVTGMQRKYEAQILTLKQKLDEAGRDREIKDDEIVNLKKQVNDGVKSLEETHINRADTINRLTHSLEESQTQCRVLLEAGTGQELGRLKIQLQEAIASRSIAQDMNTALQEEIRELKEQVTMYESASTYGVFPSTHVSTIAGQAGVMHLDDSYAQLGIKRFSSTPISDDLKTPLSNKTEITSLTQDETMHGLKSELERCLGMYRQKRQQVAHLQEGLNTTKRNLDETQAKLQVAETLAQESKTKLHSLEEKLGPEDGRPESLREAKLKKEVDCLSKDKELLMQELEETNRRLDEIASSEEKVKDLNRELSTQMAQLVKEFDEDKRTAVEKCQEACLQHHETSKEKFREELLDQWNDEKTKLEQDHTVKLNQLREDLKASQAELDEVKALYVNVCESKDNLEANLEKVWQEKLEAQLTQVKQEIDIQKQEEVKQLMATITNSNEAANVTYQEKWLKEQQESWKKRLETEVAVARLEWFKEHQSQQEHAIQMAVEKAESQQKDLLDKQLEATLDEKVNEAKEQWQKDQLLRVESEVKVKVAQERQIWQQTDLQIALAAERRRLTQESADKGKEAKAAADQEDTSEAKVKAAVREAREKWDGMHKQDMEKAVGEAISQAVSQIKEAAEKDTQRQVLQATSKLEQSVHDLKTEKNDLESKLSSIQENLSIVKVNTMRQKDLERRLAVSSVQDQCEKDYRQFLQEHQDTLNKALTSTRKQHEKEMEKLIKEHQENIEEHKEDIDGLKVKLADAEQLLIKEKTGLQELHKKRLGELELAQKVHIQEMCDKHNAEQASLMSTHRENLQRALEEAKAHWQQKYDESIKDIHGNSKDDVQQKWEEERLQLQQELEHLHEEHEQLQGELDQLHQEIETRDSLLQAADAHMEAEINKLQDDLHQNMEKEKLQLRMNLEEQYNQRLCSELETLREKINEEHAQQQAIADEDKMKLIGGLEEARKQLKQLELQNEEERQQLRRKAEHKEKEVKKLMKQLEERSNAVEQGDKLRREMVQKLERQKVEMSDKCEEYLAKIEKAEQLKQEAIESYQQAEKEHSSLLDTYNHRHKQMVEKMKFAERKIKSTEAKAEKHLHDVQESLEREHSAAMDNMKIKMVELRNSQVTAMEKLRKQHMVEKHKLEFELNILKDQRRQLANTPTQTEEEGGAEAVTELKINYLEAINKMREEVLQHVQESSEKAAEMVRREVVQERQRTAKRLRKYYLRCLSQLLQHDREGLTLQEKLFFMERALDNLPERDSSCSSTSTPREISIATSDSERRSTPHNTSVSSAPHMNTYTSASKPSASKSTKRQSRSMENLAFTKMEPLTYPSSQSDWDADSAMTTPRSIADEGSQQNVDRMNLQPVQSQTKQQRSRRTPPLPTNQYNTGHLKLSLARTPAGDIFDDITGSNKLGFQTSHQLPLSSGAGSCGNLPLEVSTYRNPLVKNTLSNRDDSRSQFMEDVRVTEAHSTYHVPHARDHYDEHVPAIQNKVSIPHSTATLVETNKSHSMQTTPRTNHLRSVDESGHQGPSMNQLHSSYKTSGPNHLHSKNVPTGVSISANQSVTTKAVPRTVVTSNENHPSLTTWMGNDGQVLHTGRQKTPQHFQQTSGDARNIGRNIPSTSSKHVKDPTAKVGRIYSTAQQAVNKTYLCRSEEALHTIPPDSTRTVPSSYKYTSILNSHLALSPRSTIDTGTSPLKSRSLTDVAGTHDMTWAVVGSTSLTDIPQAIASGIDKYKTHPEMLSTDKGSSESTSFASPRSTASTSDGQSQKRKSRRSREGYQVAFKTIDIDGDNDGSDTESHKSFASGSSVHSFRHALKQRSTSRSPTCSVSGATRKPIRALPMSPDPQLMYDDIPNDIYRPIAMVTRETQIPSPGPQKNKQEWHVRRFEENI